jgi:spore coat protein CotH
MRKSIILLTVILSFCIKGMLGQNFYDINTIQKIEIQFPYSNWDYMMDTAKAGSEGYIFATWVKVNGIQFDSVGVKYKGNSSYNINYNKNPLHIELDYYNNQDYQGYTDIKLGNGKADPSCIREPLSYAILSQYMHCPQSNFAQVYINGALRGLYSNTESVNKKFVGDHFFSTGGTLVKCNPVQVSSTNGPRLSYNGTDSAMYYNYYELKTTYAWQDLIELCDTLVNNSTNIHKILDPDRALWMLAFNNVLVNLDSYTGAFAQNYYLYMDNNFRFNTISWDLNMSFGSFTSPGNSAPLNISGMQTMNPTLHSTWASRPLIQKLLANTTYRKMYIAHMRTILNENFVNNSYVTTAQNMQTVIDTAVLSDGLKFFTYSNFQNGLTQNVVSGPSTIPGISVLMSSRATFLSSHTEFQQVPPVISNINYTPAIPNMGDTIWITASISNTNYAYLGNRTATPLIFNKTTMFDDGLHNDGTAGDGVFGGFMIANSAQMQYYIYAENTNAGIFSPERAEHVFYTILVSVPMAAPLDVTINEFMANNTSTVQEPNGGYPDWMELYNNTANNISLAGMYATDNYTIATKWSFPNNTVIPAFGYMIVWMDEDTTQLGNHANFKLSSSGERIMLSYANGTIIDSITFGAQLPDVSMQRCPNGTGSFTTSFPPTYNSANCVVGIEEQTPNDNFTVFPNPASTLINIVSTGTFKQVELYNSLGQVVHRYSGEVSSVAMDISDLSNGIYLLKVDDQPMKKLIIKK